MVNTHACRKSRRLEWFPGWGAPATCPGWNERSATGRTTLHCGNKRPRTSGVGCPNTCRVFCTCKNGKHDVLHYTVLCVHVRERVGVCGVVLWHYRVPSELLYYNIHTTHAEFSTDVSSTSRPRRQRADDGVYAHCCFCPANGSPKAMNINYTCTTRTSRH